MKKIRRFIIIFIVLYIALKLCKTSNFPLLIWIFLIAMKRTKIKNFKESLLKQKWAEKIHQHEKT